MYAITGITGQIGGMIGRILLDVRQPVRAVLRDAGKARAWKDRGCELALATIEDTASLTAAFRGVECVFVLVPPNFDPQPGFPEAWAIGSALRSALDTARPARVVYLSTIGAQASPSNLLTQHTIIEQMLSDLPVSITFLRPAWFMENCRWDVVPAREQGVIPSFLQPLDKPVPMVAIADIGKMAAALMQEPWSGPSGGVGRTSPRNSKRDRSWIHESPGPLSANANRAAPFLGGAFQVAGDEEPTISYANAGWL